MRIPRGWRTPDCTCVACNYRRRCTPMHYTWNAFVRDHLTRQEVGWLEMVAEAAMLPRAGQR